MSRNITTIPALILVFYLSAFAQLLVKNSSDVTMMQVTSSGTLGIGIGDAAPAATLDVGGDVHIGTVLDLTGTADASVLVLDNGVVKKRTLATEIWDGDESYSAGSAIDIVPLAGNEHEIDVVYDNTTIKLNGSNQLYAVAPTESDPVWTAAKPTSSSTSSGTELTWNGTAFQTQQVLYLRGYIETQQSFPSGSYDVASLARKVQFDQLYSSDNTNHINSSGEFIVPKTAYYFLSATVGVVDDPTDVTLAVFKSTNGGTSWAMDINGNATPLRVPTTAVMVTGIIHAEEGDRLVVGLRNASGVDCKSVAYNEPAAPVESQNILTIMELP